MLNRGHDTCLKSAYLALFEGVIVLACGLQKLYSNQDNFITLPTLLSIKAFLTNH